MGGYCSLQYCPGHDAAKKFRGVSKGKLYFFQVIYCDELFICIMLVVHIAYQRLEYINTEYMRGTRKGHFVSFTIQD